MRTRTLLIALASASVVAAGPALSQGRGGGQGGGQGGGAAAGANVGGSVGRGGMDVSTGVDVRGSAGTRTRRVDTNPMHRSSGDTGSTRREEARANSQGPANASETGIENANENSVLSGATVTDLSGLAVDTAIVDEDGDAVGTVSRITRSGDRIRNVFVNTTDGTTVRLRAGSLSLDGSTFVTSDSRFND